MLGKIKIEDYTPQFILDRQMKETPDPKRSESIKNFHQALKTRYHSHLNLHNFESEITAFIQDTDFFGVDLETTTEADFKASQAILLNLAKSLVAIKESVLGDTSWHI